MLRIRINQLFLALIINLVIGTGAFAGQQTVTPGSTRSEWKIAFELAFGENSPYSKKFPDLYSLPYDVNLAITREVLDQIVKVMLNETKAKRIKLTYRPGGYKDFPVVPSAQLEIRCTDKTAQDAMNILGFLAQQTTIIASKRIEYGNRHALLILQTKGKDLDEPKQVEKFWHRLGELLPKLQPGFSSIKVKGRPGLYIIDSEGDWLAEDLLKFPSIVDSLSREFAIATTTEEFQVNYVELGNDWKLYAQGEQYLHRLYEGGLNELRRRLVDKYLPKVELWIKKAFEKFSPVSLKQKQEQAKPLKPFRDRNFKLSVSLRDKSPSKFKSLHNYYKRASYKLLP